MNALVTRYKIPLLISLVVALCQLALNAESNTTNIIFTVLGAIIGTVLLDLEYILAAYITDPKSEMSTKFKSEVIAKNVFSYARFFNDYEYKFTDLPMRSVLFQFLLMIFAYYVVITNSFIMAQSMVLAMLGTIFYFQLIEIVNLGTLDRWAWIYKGTLTKTTSFAYWGICLVFFLIIFAYV